MELVGSNGSYPLPLVIINAIYWALMVLCAPSFRKLGCIVVGIDAKLCPLDSLFCLCGCVWHYLHNSPIQFTW
jgi:hypothetical protein